VLTTPDLRRAADALDAIIARLGDRDTTAVLTGMKGLRLERLDQKLLWRLEADRSFYDLEMTDEEAAGTLPPLAPGSGRRRPAAAVLAGRRQLVVNAPPIWPAASRTRVVVGRASEWRREGFQNFFDWFGSYHRFPPLVPARTRADR